MCAKLHNEMEDTAKATGENSEETKKQKCSITMLLPL